MATSRVAAAVLLPNGGRRRGEPLAPHEDALQLDYDTTKGRKRGRGWVGKENRGRALSDIHNTDGRTRLPGLIRCILAILSLIHSRHILIIPIGMLKWAPFASVCR